MKACLIALLLALLFGAGCVNNGEPTLEVASRAYNPEPNTETSPTSTRTVEVNAPEIQASPSSPPTAIPTEITLPQLALFVPDIWRETTVAALDRLKSNGSPWLFHLVDQANSADIVMVEGLGDISAGQRPVAIIAPFTSPIEELSSGEVESLVLENSYGLSAVDWGQVPVSFKALRIDGYLPHEPGYPLQQSWSLVASEEYKTPATELGSILYSMLSYEDQVQVTAVGDIMLDRSLGRAITTLGPDHPFANVSQILTAADITVGNMESGLGVNGDPVSKSYNFRAPPEAVQALVLGGFDLLSVANNHALDYGPESLLEAIDLLYEAGIIPLGAGANASEARQPVIIEDSEIRVAFLAYVDVPVESGGFDTKTWEASDVSAGVAWAAPAHIYDDVVEAKKMADVVVVLLHSGYEHVQQPSPTQVEASKAAIDAGASLVIGHHSHVIQGVEFYKGGMIVYGLGNFAFDMDGSRESVILNVLLDGDGVRYFEFTPVIIGQGGQPRVADETESALIKQELYRLSDLLSLP